MTISNKVFIEFNNKELNALAIISDILDDLQDRFPEEAVLSASFTGEVVEIREIARIKGALSSLVANAYWDVEVPKPANNDDDEIAFFDFSEV